MKKLIFNRKDERGVALAIVIMTLAIILIVGIMLVKMTSMNLKSSVEKKKGLERFYGAEGGIFAVAGWMTFYKRFDLPQDVLKTDSYEANAKVLGETVRYQVGYSTLWKGSDVLINSESPPGDPKAEIEAVVFIPVFPVGYGNE